MVSRTREQWYVDGRREDAGWKSETAHRVIAETTPSVQPSIAATSRSAAFSGGQKNCGSDPSASANCNHAAAA